MKKLILLVIIIISFFQKVQSCGNEYGYSLDGKKKYTRYFFLSDRMQHFDTIYIQKKIETLSLQLNSSEKKYKIWSDIAVNLLKLGGADSSIRILRPLLKEHAREYNIIANLGTAYELTGQLDSALKYISQGYELNKKSHRGSEWVHIKILESKLKEKTSRGWIDSHSILNIDELKERVKANDSKRIVTTINQEIFYQIRTRAPFTPAPNKTLANILVTLGDFNFEEGTYENALLSYAYALKFQSSAFLSRKIENKIEKLNLARRENTKQIPSEFMRMVKRAMLSPDLLLLGLDDFAEELDSIHMEKIQRVDSLNIMNLKVDSLKMIIVKNNVATENFKIEFENELSYLKYLFLFIGVLLGLIISVLVVKMRK